MGRRQRGQHPDHQGPPAHGAAARRRALEWTPPPARLEAWLGAAGALIAVLGLGLALRLVHLVALAGSPFFDHLVLDARYYDAWAKEIAGGAWVGTAAFWVDPLYAYALGAIYAVAGHNLLWPRLLNVACGLATAWVVADIARRVWDSRAAAVLAAAAAVLFVPATYFEGQVEKTALSLLLVTAALALFLRATPRALLAAGAVAGLATLARGNALLLAAAALACLLLGWERDAPPAAAVPPRARLGRAGLFLAGLLPMLAVATLHNWLATGALVPTTTNLGVNLYLGNHAGNAYGRYTPPDFLRPDTGAEQPDFRAEAERRLNRAVGDVELSSYWRDQALAAIAADPGLAVRRTASKLFFALNDAEIPDNEDVSMVGEWSPVLRAPLLWMGVLLPLAVLGAVLGWRRRGVRIVALTAALYVASLLPFFIMSRLRVQIAPLLCVLAGGALVWLTVAVQQRRTRALAAAAALLLPLALLAHWRTEEMIRHHRGSVAVAWNNLGAGFTDAGETGPAIAAFERAVAIDAATVPASLRALGELYRRQGDLARAEATLRRLVEIKPQSPSAREALRQVQAQRGSPATATAAAAPAPAAASPADSAAARARALGRAGDPAGAIRVLQEAVRRGPYDENLRYMLGETMAKHAPPAELVRFFSAEVARDEKPQTSHYYWAVGLARGGDTAGAIAQLQRALEIDPAHEVSQRQWGLLLEQQGQLDAALEHLLEATRIHPDFRPAWEDAARVAAAAGRPADAETYRQRAAAADPGSDRRYLHWARYLHGRGRHAAAWAELQHLLAVRPDDAEALALREQLRPHLDAATLAATAAPRPAAAAPSAAGLDAAARDALLDSLRTQPGATAWITWDGRDAAATARAAELAAAFREAGWQVAGHAPASLPLRPGLFLFVADEPSPRTEAVAAALTAGGLTHTLASGYREFSQERRQADPNWRGLTLAPEQEFVIVVGRPG